MKNQSPPEGTKHREREIIMKLVYQKQERLLFNAFSLANPELLARKPPYDLEYLLSITRAFNQYKNALDAMGQHPLYSPK